MVKRMRDLRRLLILPALACLLGACAATTSGTAAGNAATAQDAPYPSTYTPYPGTPTALVGATVYDGKGGTHRERHRAVFRRQGGGDRRCPTVESLRATRGSTAPESSSPPASSTFTPISATIPSPSVAAHSDGNEMTDPTTPQGLGRTYGLAAGPGLHPRARQWRGHQPADPARLGQSDGRAVGHAEERAERAPCRA